MKTQKELLNEWLDKENSLDKRYEKIDGTWRKLTDLSYSDDDYGLWLEDMTAEDIENQINILDTGIENMKKVQRRLHEICQERRKIRRVK